MIGDDVVVEVLEVSGQSVRIGIAGGTFSPLGQSLLGIRPELPRGHERQT